MDQMAKSPTSATPSPTPVATMTEAAYVVEGVPFELYRHFGIDIRQQDPVIQQCLKDIFAFGRHDSLTEALLDIKSIEMGLGIRQDTTRYMKVRDYLKLTNQIKELEKQRMSL